MLWPAFGEKCQLPLDPERSRPRVAFHINFVVIVGGFAGVEQLQGPKASLHPVQLARLPDRVCSGHGISRAEIDGWLRVRSSTKPPPDPSKLPKYRNTQRLGQSPEIQKTFL